MLHALLNLDLEHWKSIAVVAGAVVALVTLIKGVIEYTHQGAQKRAEHFISMRERLKKNTEFENLCDLLEDDDAKLQSISYKDKLNLLGFFEEVALMMNSRLIKKDVAH
jgi:alpha-D-ribose 1-methylphosphonate 5-triphosphate diphosphatase PhnM